MANELDEMAPSSGTPAPAAESRKKSFFGGFSSGTQQPQMPAGPTASGYHTDVNQDLQSQARKTFF
jgi:hypothetical protein